MRPFAFLLLFVLLVAAVPARAAVRLWAPAGRTLHAGDQVELRWDGLGAGIDEVEFELSLDGGRWIRVSPELDALEQRWVWRVPSLAAEHARLRLRGGGSHREEVAAVGEAFRIAAAPGDDREFLGEWWPALDRGTTDTAPEGLTDGEAPVLSALVRTHAAEAPVTPSLLAPTQDSGALPRDTRIEVPATLSRARSARPAFVPLRN